MLTLHLGSLRSGLHGWPRIRCFVPAFSVFSLSLSIGCTSVCQGQNWTPAEKQAVTQIAQGNPGDFSDRSSAVSDVFIERLLSGGFKDADPSHNMAIHGIVISNAIFQKAINIHFEVPYRVIFEQCQFQKGLDFSGSQFDRDLVFDNTTFGTTTSYPQKSSDDDSDPAVQFINATVNGTVSIQNGAFYLPVDFTKAHIKELDIENANYASANQDDPDLDLSAVSVESDLSLSVKTTQPRKVDAALLNVGRLASLGTPGTAGKGFFATNEFYLANSHFQKITIYGFKQWLANRQASAVSLDGFSFQEIGLPCDGKFCSPAEFLQLLDSPQVSYSPQPYLVLEQYLNANGDADDANNVYIHMRKRQRGRRMSSAARVADWFLEWVVGYGREPVLSVWWTLGFIALGMLLFSPHRMVAQQGQDGQTDPGQTDLGKKSPAYSRFWYSLDVLAPAIELGADKAWQPDPNWWLGRNYSYVHRIVGWILAPLILAALTGVIH